MKTLQTGTMISENGRDGKIEADDKTFAIDFQAAGETKKDGITPEHLFAGAYAACFHSALKAQARKAHKAIEGSTLTARVRLVERDDGELELAVELRASLPGVSVSEGEHLLHQAHARCPYSKAVRGNIGVTLALD